MSKSIKAAVCRAFNAPLTIETLTLAAPGAGEVQVEMEAVAICHSDISYIDGGWGGTLPAVYGHEGVGRVTAAGPGVSAVAEGDRVLVTLIRACHSCTACATGHPAYCDGNPARDTPLADAAGAPVLGAMNCGAFAEAVTVDASQLVRIPEDMPAESACLLSCGVITGIGAAVNTAALRPGQIAVVVGAGGVGLNAIQGARIAGAARIAAIDMSEEKLAIAREFGATDGILANDPEALDKLHRVAPKGADAVLLCTGAIQAYQGALDYLAPRGQVILVGMPHVGQKVDYEPVDMAAAGQGIVGSKMGDAVPLRDIPWMIDLYRQGRLKLDELVSGRWSLEQINEAIADTKTGGARRNVILF
ncbi:alcohol dehydrogenase catalytic domain-containing protein [Aliiruegeria lutimaris]|uniref:S-(Hydroxymethyl)mycothiol dehydrogenase n=1 Tax=Aliiruegeria lutimaris TaxID=571298 RepID=A0A1G9H0V3_9RHOB|nr:alcohol dehydrogenase catalytic domain-containing protein [Aliiruegeria lutimaris]SDL06570.1 S-(hydroxymethyl)mycothiol dehydrogenase [Aliiruegeria lutimaris]